MKNEKLDYHRRMDAAAASISRGELGPYETVGHFAGAFDQPIQWALRHKKTGRVVLADLMEDGRLILPH